jgi:hypothetical protein
MTQEASELLQKALALSEKERAELAGSLIESLDATADSEHAPQLEKPFAVAGVAHAAADEERA